MKYLFTLLFIIQFTGHSYGQNIIDTLKFGSFYIHNGEANLPLTTLKTENNSIFGAITANQWAFFHVDPGGILSNYKVTVEIASGNGELRKADGVNNYYLKSDPGEKKLLLRVTVDFEGDILYVILKETENDSTLLKHEKDVYEYPLEVY